MRRKKCHRVICCILSLVLTLVALVKIDNSAFESKDAVEINDRADIHEINYLENESVDLFEEEVPFFEKVKQRIDTPQDDLRIVKYLMNDGTVEMRIFNDPLKYVTDNGEVHTKSMKICELSGDDTYKYSNIDNDIIMKFGSDYSKGVTAEFNGHSISFYPYNASKAEAKFDEKSNTVFYDGVFSSNTRVEYKAQYSGLKEDIVLEKYDGVNSFSFEVESKERVKFNNGKLGLYDENGVFYGCFSDVIIRDAVGNFALGETRCEKSSGNGYIITIIVPDSFLTNDNTEYPVVVDPSFVFNYYTNTFAGYKQICDVTLSQYGYIYQPSADTLTITQNPYYGFERAIVKFPNLNTILNKIGHDNISYVMYSYYSFTSATNSVTIWPMSVNWQSNATSLTNTVYDSLYNGYNQTVSLSRSIHFGPGQIDITPIAQDWANNEYSNYGVMISGNGSYSLLASAEASNSFNCPYLAIGYNCTEAVHDPLEGLKKLIPYSSSTVMSDYAMSNGNAIVMTSINDNIYNSNQLLLVTWTYFGYTIQNPYNGYYLTSNNNSVYFASTLASGSYWSFVNNGTGYFIIGTSNEQLDCASPNQQGASVGIKTQSEGISESQATIWFVSRQINKIPFRLKNVSSEKYLTVANAYDYDGQNIFQYSLYDSNAPDVYKPVFGSQEVRVYYDNENSCYNLKTMASKNGRLRTVSWDSFGNAYQYKPTINNRLTITFTANGLAIIRQKTGSKNALAVTNDANGSKDGTGINSSGNIVFTTYNSTDDKQKWILEPDIEQLRKESYYSQFSVYYPLPNDEIHKQINSDFGPRQLNNNDNIHDGIDLCADAWTRVESTISGKVVKIRASLNDPIPQGGVDIQLRGYYVLVRSTINEYSSNSPLCLLVQHLDYVSVSEGDTVSPSTLLGYSGTTGTGLYSYPAHFHYSYCLESDFLYNNRCNFVDPLLFHPTVQLYETVDNDRCDLIPLT